MGLGTQTMTYTGSDAQVDASGLLNMINSRLEHLAGRVIDSNHDLSMLAERTFGPSPMTAAGGSKLAPTSGPPSMADSLNNWLDTLTGVIAANAELSRGLNSRI